MTLHETAPPECSPAYEPPGGGEVFYLGGSLGGRGLLALFAPPLPCARVHVSRL